MNPEQPSEPEQISMMWDQGGAVHGPSAFDAIAATIEAPVVELGPPPSVSSEASEDVDPLDALSVAAARRGDRVETPAAPWWNPVRWRRRSVLAPPGEAADARRATFTPPVPAVELAAVPQPQGASAAPPAQLVEPSFAELAPEPPVRKLAQLDAVDITAWFGAHQVLDRVSLTMSAGVVTALIGPSGCGKSTFLRILNRMHELVPSASLAGQVLLDGEDIYDRSRPITEARKHIGMVFQKPNPFPAMSIYDNVIAGLRLTGTRVDRDRADYLVERSLTRAGLWNEVRDRLRAPGGGLSGGQQQRLCIARSLAVTPKVLLMDEPCSALDPTSTRVIEETMLELAKEVTIVIVTHNMQQAQRVSTQCAFFLASQGRPGGIVEYGDTEAMFADPIDSRTFDYVNGRFG